MHNHDTSKIDKDLLEEVCLLLKDYPDANRFVIEYRKYIHMIDDLIDNPLRPIPEEILAMAAQASYVFSLPFYTQHSSLLFLVEQMINNTYADSVEWETINNSAWQQSDAGVLRHAGIDMFFAVILITNGREALRKISSRFRTHTHLLHMDENMKAV